MSVLVAVTLASCGGSHGAARAQSTSKATASATSTAPAPPSFDPPTAFDAKRPLALPQPASANTTLGGRQNAPPPIALLGVTAVIQSASGTELVNTATYQTLPSVRPNNAVLGSKEQLAASSTASIPVATTLDGEPIALSAFAVRLPGRGTTPPALGLELDVTAASGRRVAAITAHLSGSLTSLAQVPTATIAGVSGSEVIIAVGGGADSTQSVAVSLTTHRVLWHRANFAPQVTAHGVAVGLISHGVDNPGHLVGVSAALGVQLWRSPLGLGAAQIALGGPRTAVVSTSSSASSASELALLNVTSGTEHVLGHAREFGSGLTWTCSFDDRSVDVCTAASPSTQTFGLDGRSGKLLWQLPDRRQNRIAPTVTDAWHGAVYGYTANGPVVLNARTGRDRRDAPGISPVLVDANTGIAEPHNGNALAAFPPTH